MPVRQGRDTSLESRDKMKSVAPSSQAMQRVRVGMVGLAAVILLIGLASAIFSAANREQPIAAPGAPRAEEVANMTAANAASPADPDNEPLAQLGVAPSAAESPQPTPAPNPASAQPAPATATGGAR